MSDKKKPNILLVVTDQWRADCLGASGHPVVETPHLDEIFFEGSRFNCAYSASPTCVAARAALLTGLTPRGHGRVGYEDGYRWDYNDTLPDVLSQAGYHTQCIGKMHVDPTRSLQGFHNVVLHNGTLSNDRRSGQDYDELDDYRLWLREQTGGRADVVDTGLGANSWVVKPWPYEEMLHPSNWVVTQSLDFLRRRDPEKPFFLKMSFVRPHPPFDPPLHYLQRYEQKELPPLPMGDWADTEDAEQQGLRARFGGGNVDPAQRDHARRAYYALITQIDHQLGRIFLELQWRGLWEDTIVVFCSDHGEMLGDHNLWAKARAYEGSSRIPLLFRFPKSWGLGTRRELDQPVELRDLYPTLCDAAGIDVPDSVEGRSLMPLLHQQDVAWRDFIHGEHTFWGGSNQWLTDGKEKYVWFTATGEEQLFDLREDPQELKNLAHENAERTAFWRAQMVRQLADREEGFVQDGKLVPGCPGLKHLEKSYQTAPETFDD